MDNHDLRYADQIALLEKVEVLQNKVNERHSAFREKIIELETKIKDLELQLLNARAMLAGKTSLHRPKITKTN